VNDTYEMPNNVAIAVPQPMVSVCIATYQHAEFIAECIESVLMQETGFQWELLVGEDFSNDGTREMVFEYAQGNPDKIRVLTSDHNVGLKRNKQRLLLASRGKYIAPLDGDDYWTDPLKLQKQVGFMEENPSYSMCYHYHKVMENEKISELALPRDGKDFSPEELICTPSGIAVATKLVRNIYANPTEKDTLDYFNDYDMNIIMGEFGGCKFLREIRPSIRRVHTGGDYTSKNEKEQLHAGIRQKIRAYQYFFNKNDEYRTMIALRALKSFLETKSKEIDSEKGPINISSERFKIAYKSAKIEVVYAPVTRRIKALFQRG
jgi:glycosyltransferase involved in cell wall biosynthesis